MDDPNVCERYEKHKSMNREAIKSNVHLFFNESKGLVESKEEVPDIIEKIIANEYLRIIL